MMMKMTKIMITNKMIRIRRKRINKDLLRNYLKKKIIRILKEIKNNYYRELIYKTVFLSRNLISKI
jgi:hypothetical protein